MKKMLLVLAMVAGAFDMWADTETVGGYTWTYRINGNTAEIYGTYNSATKSYVPAISPYPTGSVTVPAILGRMPVTSIGTSAFYNCSNLTDVTIGNRVTCIGTLAFSGCSGLANVIIPGSVTSIGSSAFSYCRGLTSATIGNGVTSIGGYAFSGCIGLTNVTIPNSVTNIEGSAFSGCDSLFNTTTISGVKLVDGWAVGYEGSLSGDVNLTGVRGIGDEAFSGCSGLTSVTIGRGITIGIGDNAFSGCGGLTSVTIGNGVTRIGNGAFSGCSGLTSVTIPDSVTRIGIAAFSGCSYSLFDTTKIPGVRLVDGWAIDHTSPLSGDVNLTDVRGIGDNAFNGCRGLTSVTMPNSVTSIGDMAFYGCSGLTSVPVPNGVTSIGDSAFYGCSGLPRIAIPDSVTYIGNSAFGGCSGLMSISVGPGNPNYKSVNGLLLSKDGKTLIQGVNGNVTIPDGVASVVDYAFSGRDGLMSVTILDSVTSIGNSVFYGCSGIMTVHVIKDDTDRVKGMLLGSGYDVSGVTFVEDAGISSGGEGGGAEAEGTCGGSPSVVTTVVQQVVTTVVQQVVAPYALTDHAADRAIASVTVDADCAIDSFVLKDGKVYDCVVRIVNTAGKDVKVSLPAGYAYETYKGVKPLTIPANSRNMLSITRVADRTFLVSREELEDVR